MTTALLALRNVFRNKRRTCIVFLSISAAMSAMIVFGGFINYTFEGLRESTIRTQLGHFQIAQRGYFEQGASQSRELLISSPQRLETKLQTVPHISNDLQKAYRLRTDYGWPRFAVCQINRCHAGTR
ncbi:efflux ABC transporter permease [Escherichia coli]|nr:efflux ABC transporter permease [Escherichia coli]